MSPEAEELPGSQRVFRPRVCAGKGQDTAHIILKKLCFEKKKPRGGRHALANALQTGTFSTVSVYPDGQPQLTYIQAEPSEASDSIEDPAAS